MDAFSSRPQPPERPAWRIPAFLAGSVLLAAVALAKPSLRIDPVARSNRQLVELQTIPRQAPARRRRRRRPRRQTLASAAAGQRRSPVQLRARQRLFADRRSLAIRPPRGRLEPRRLAYPRRSRRRQDSRRRSLAPRLPLRQGFGPRAEDAAAQAVARFARHDHRLRRRAVRGQPTHGRVGPPPRPARL